MPIATVKRRGGSTCHLARNKPPTRPHAEPKQRYDQPWVLFSSYPDRAAIRGEEGVDYSRNGRRDGIDDRL